MKPTPSEQPENEWVWKLLASIKPDPRFRYLAPTSPRGINFGQGKDRENEPQQQSPEADTREYRFRHSSGIGSGISVPD